MTLAEQDTFYGAIDAASQHKAYLARHAQTDNLDAPHALTVKASVASALRSNQAIIDSGTNRHIFNNRKLFTTYQELNKQVPITLANNRTIYAIGEGTISVRTAAKPQNALTISSVLHAPKLSGNLISTSYLQKYKGTTTAGAGLELAIVKNGEKIVVGDDRGGVYVVDLHSSSAVENTQNDKIFSLYSGVKQTTNLMTWHRRLGHLNLADVRKLAGGLATGIHISTRKTSEVCHHCLINKSTRQPFMKHMHAKQPGLLDLIHSDLAGPLPRSKGGHEFYATFVDDYSNFTYIYFLKTKAEALASFKSFVAEVERKTSRKVKAI